MDYSPVKAKYTRLVLNFAKCVPYLFPSRIRYLCRDPDFGGSLRANRPLEFASLFYDPDGNIKLQGICLVIELSHEDILKARSWHERCKSHPLDRRHLNAFYSRSYLSAPRENILGQITLGTHCSPHVLDRVDAGSDIFGCCTLSLVHIPSGSAYLNLYVSVREERAYQLQRMDVSSIRPVVQFDSYNPFGRNGSTWHFSVDNLAEDFMRKEIGRIQDDAVRCVSAVLAKIKISLTPEHYLFKAWDFTNNAETLEAAKPMQPYRVGTQEPQEYIYKAYLRPSPSEITNKSIYVDFGDSKDCYDLISVESRKSAPSDSDSESGVDFFQRGTPLIFESAMVLSLTEHVYYKVNRQRELLERHIGFARTTISSEKKQKSLYSIIQSLTAARDELGHLAKYREWICPDDYLAFYRGRLEAIKAHSEKILERAELEYKFTNDAIGMRVIRSNTTYSRVLGGFALIQIALAYFAVDWSKQGDITSSIRTWLIDTLAIAATTCIAIVDFIF